MYAENALSLLDAAKCDPGVRPRIAPLAPISGSDPVESPHSNHRSGWRMKKLRMTSSTSESAGSVDQRLMYSGRLSAMPANSRLACRIGQFASYITSGGFGHDFLSLMYGAMEAMGLCIQTPSGR